jgi:MFS family permease
MTDTIATPSDARAKRNVFILVAAQAVVGAQLPVMFIIGGLSGQMLAPNPCWATLPISMIVLGSMLAATPLSAIMQAYGRRAGFWLACICGAIGAMLAAYGLYAGSFLIFLLGSLLSGVYMSANGFYRFAAADMASPEFRPKAISYVMAGGLLSAVFGPQLVSWTADSMAVPFMATYLGVIGLNIAGMVLLGFLDIPTPAKPEDGAPTGRPVRDLLSSPIIAVAIICGTVSYALMNLVMTSTPLAVVGCGFATGDAANIVSAHVLAMYAPSFFTGHLIARFGARIIVAVGLVILALSGAVAMSGVALEQFYIALILLGIGWNFGFIGATTMLTSAYSVEERGRVQGLNDMIVFGGVFVASLSSGTLMNCSGGTAETGWQLVNMAMLPFLVLAGAALIWLAARPKDA